MTTDKPSPQLKQETEQKGFKVELVVNDRCEATVFQNKPFRKRLSWLEFDMDNYKLDFVMNDGDIRNFNIPVDPSLAKHLQNAHRVLMVEVDDETGDPKKGDYFPLIIHKN